MAIIVRRFLPKAVFSTHAGTQRRVNWIPAFAGMTGRESSNLRDTRLTRFFLTNSTIGT